MLQACVVYFEGQQEKHFALAEFSYNNNYHLIIEMAPYEELYNRHFQSLIEWFETSKVMPYGTNLVWIY